MSPAPEGIFTVRPLPLIVEPIVAVTPAETMTDVPDGSDNEPPLRVGLPA